MVEGTASVGRTQNTRQMSVSVDLSLMTGRTGVRQRQATGKRQTQQNQETPPLNDDYDDDLGMLVKQEDTQDMT